MTRVVLLGLTMMAVPALHAQEAPHIALGPADAVARARFTVVNSVRELSDGSVLVADQGEKRLYRMEWDSPAATAIGGIGDGPGEYRRVGGLYALGRDSTLFVDRYNGRWNLLDGGRIVETVSERRPLNELLKWPLHGADTAGHVLGVRGYVEGGTEAPLHDVADSLLVLLAHRSSERVDTLARIRGQGGGGMRIERGTNGRPGTIVLQNPLASEEQALLFPDGWIAVARLDAYRVDWQRPDGSWVHGAPLPWTRIEVDDDVKCATIARRPGGDVRCDPSFYLNWPKTAPPFLLFGPYYTRVLLAAPDGRLVVARTPIGDAPENYYDLVDRTGRLSATLTLPDNTAVVGFGAHSVYVLVKDEMDLETLERHPWPSN